MTKLNDEPIRLGCPHACSDSLLGERLFDGLAVGEWQECMILSGKRGFNIHCSKYLKEHTVFYHRHNGTQLRFRVS